MQARAKARYIRMSPRKARRVLRLIQGLPVGEAQSALALMPHRAARAIRRVVDSAVANAENNHGMEPEDLWVASATVDAGPTMKRWRFASGGRVGMVRKRISHISVVVSDDEP
ncbi:MAG: 50S ribosomal protein L22 [Armatimonadetes bacterium]|nr:50S ribosomal protein L22 [Armatimonadota bacterium]